MVAEDGQGPVIVNASMEFLRQLHYPGDIIGRMSVGKPGRSSFDTRFELVSRRRSRHALRAGRGALRMDRLRGRQIRAVAGWAAPAIENAALENTL